VVKCETFNIVAYSIINKNLFWIFTNNLHKTLHGVSPSAVTSYWYKLIV
jgi:hypothetical protein